MNIKLEIPVIVIALHTGLKRPQVSRIKHDPSYQHTNKDPATFDLKGYDSCGIYCLCCHFLSTHPHSPDGTEVLSVTSNQTSRYGSGFFPKTLVDCCLLHAANEVMFSSACVSLLVSRITQIYKKRFPRNSLGWLGMIHGRTHSIF